MKKGFPIKTVSRSQGSVWEKYGVRRGPVFVLVKKGKEVKRASGKLGVTRLKGFWTKIDWSAFSLSG